LVELLQASRAGWIEPVQGETFAVLEEPKRVKQTICDTLGGGSYGVSHWLHGGREEQHSSQCSGYRDGL
jgi:hypothetical protein